jgi:DHA1 family inner membrane transport protein
MIRLLILSFAALAFGTNTFTIVGLLTELAAALEVSVATAGQVQTAFVLVAAVAGPALAVATRRLDRRLVLSVSLALLAATALLSAAATTLGELLAARALAGFAGALVLPLATAAAAGLASPEKRGSAVAMVLLGMTAALLFAAPACTALGAAFGWPAAFLFSGVLAALAALAAQIGLPRLEGTAAKPAPLGREALARLAPLWAATLFSFTAAFSMTSYLSPIAGRLAGAQAAEVGLFQVMIGIGSFTGIILGGRAADRGAGLGRLAGGLGVIAVSIAVVALAFVAVVPSASGGLLLPEACWSAPRPVQPHARGRRGWRWRRAPARALALTVPANYLGQAAGRCWAGCDRAPDSARRSAGRRGAPAAGRLIILPRRALQSRLADSGGLKSVANRRPGIDSPQTLFRLAAAGTAV